LPEIQKYYFKLKLLPMKRSFLLLLVSLFTLPLLAADLVLIPTKSVEESKSLFKSPSLTINFYRDEFVIATLHTDPKKDFIVLDHNPWSNGLSYYLVYLDKHVDKEKYFDVINPIADVLHDGGYFLIVRIDETLYGQLPPAKNDGAVRLFENEVELPTQRFTHTLERFDPDPFVLSLLDMVNGPNITADVQHLEDYGTRDCYHPNSVLAEQWIETKFLAMGLDVEVMDFSMPGGSSSDNVIATLTGTKYPDEYVVLGGHYDSRSWSGPAPGADDNASGTSGVIEIARILSQYDFDRSIIFCAFSGEEYGLYGSAAYASRSAQQGMNILGYFNMDMIGYLKPGHTTIMTSLIYPQSAQPLADFYTTVTGVYLPDFVVVPASFTGGDSDHTSFNNNGYMGIFPFEDVNNYSPHIHTSNDLVGPSYNHEAQAVIFTQAILASVVTMANMKMPPQNLVAIPGDEKVELQWNEMVDIDLYKIYRDDALIDSTLTNYYLDSNVENGTLYEYYVTAIYADSGEESSPSNVAHATPMPPIGLPLMIDFENGAPYWNLGENWGLTTTQSYSPSHSLTESPGGNYGNNWETYATLSPLNLMGFTSASLSFWTRYNIENNWDFMYLEITTDGINWTELDSFTGNQTSWVKKTYSLNNYLNNPYVVIRFHFYSDFTITAQGMYIDDFEIIVEGGYNIQLVEIPEGWSGISSYILPAQSQVENLMQPIFDDLVILQSLTGAYWPAQNVNTIGNWDAHSGYKIKVSDNVNLEVAGTYLENKTIDLAQGWNLLPVLSDCTVSCNELFAEVANVVEIVKDVAGTNVYWPDQEIYSLMELTPGLAYFIKTNAPVSITFPDCTSAESETKSGINKTESFWEMIPPTGNSHVVSIPAAVIQEFEVGDQIGVFTLDGLCAGSVLIDDLVTNKALVVFANDSVTQEIDGFIPNEQFIFKLYEAATGIEYYLIPGYDMSMPHAGSFEHEGLSALTDLVIDNTGIMAPAQMVSIFPNPATGHVVINLINAENARVDVTNLAGQLVLSNRIVNNATLNTSSLSKGVYTFRIKTDEFTEVHKVVIR
jgi:hypothetical protein